MNKVSVAGQSGNHITMVLVLVIFILWLSVTGRLKNIIAIVQSPSVTGSTASIPANTVNVPVTGHTSSWSLPNPATGQYGLQPSNPNSYGLLPVQP